jgi:hypothetical protein
MLSQSLDKQNVLSVQSDNASYQLWVLVKQCEACIFRNLQFEKT